MRSSRRPRATAPARAAAGAATRSATGRSADSAAGIRAPIPCAIGYRAPGDEWAHLDEGSGTSSEHEWKRRWRCSGGTDRRRRDGVPRRHRHCREDLRCAAHARRRRARSRRARRGRAPDRGRDGPSAVDQRNRAQLATGAGRASRARAGTARGARRAGAAHPRRPGAGPRRRRALRSLGRRAHARTRRIRGPPDRTDARRRARRWLAAVSVGAHAGLGCGHSLGGRRSTARKSSARAGSGDSMPGSARSRAGAPTFTSGVDFDCGEWVDRATAERVIVFCQSASPTRYLEQLRAIARDGARPLELVFPSRTLADRFGRGHAVLPPPLDVAAIRSTRVSEGVVYDEWLIEAPAPWPVGIVGQRQEVIEEPDDFDFARSLSQDCGTAAHLRPRALSLRARRQPRNALLREAAGRSRTVPVAAELFRRSPPVVVAGLRRPRSLCRDGAWRARSVSAPFHSCRTHRARRRRLPLRVDRRGAATALRSCAAHPRWPLPSAARVARRSAHFSTSSCRPGAIASSSTAVHRSRIRAPSG